MRIKVTLDKEVIAADGTSYHGGSEDHDDFQLAFDKFLLGGYWRMSYSRENGETVVLKRDLNQDAIDIQQFKFGEYQYVNAKKHYFKSIEFTDQ